MVDAFLQVVKNELAKVKPIKEQEQAALKRAVYSLEEGVLATSERQKKIKLANCSDYRWEMVAAYKKDKLAKNSSDEKKIEKVKKEVDKQ